LQNNKLKSLLKSFRFRFILISFLAAAIIVFILYNVDFRKFTSVSDPQIQQQENDIGSNIDYSILADRCSREIDSVLYNFGIKKEWITTASKKENSSVKKVVC